MNKLTVATILAIAAIAILGAQGAYAECVPTSAPAESLSINLPENPTGIDYAEERELCVATSTPDLTRGEGCGYDVDFPVRPPPPFWGRQFGEGTWMYEETNGLPGLQAGGFGIVCEGPFGLLTFCETVDDETCGAGPDRLIF